LPAPGARGALAALLVLAGLVGSPPARAQQLDRLPEQIGGLQQILTGCEATVDSLLQERAHIRHDSDRLAAERERVHASGTRTEELGFLARLADLSAEEDRVSGLLRVQQATCEECAARLETAIDARLGQSGPAALPGGVRDSLQRVQVALQTRNHPSGRVDIPLPRASDDDGPEDLSFRAELARDLADRLRRWAHYVDIHRRALEEETRLRDELVELLQDDELFGDDLMQGGENASAEPVSWRVAAWEDGVLDQIEALKTQAGIEGEEWTALGLLAALEEWLQLKRAALLERAASLEQEALLRGGRPEVE